MIFARGSAASLGKGAFWAVCTINVRSFSLTIRLRRRACTALAESMRTAFSSQPTTLVVTFASETFSTTMVNIVAGRAESFAFSGIKGDEQVIETLTGNASLPYRTKAIGYSPAKDTVPKSRSSVFVEVSPSFLTTTAKPESTGESGR